VLILGFVTITTPVTLMLLVRAALFRDTAEGRIDDVRQRAKRKPRKEEQR
jgi:multicomponent K+:H+ antiporter subunit G